MELQFILEQKKKTENILNYSNFINYVKLFIFIKQNNS